VTSFDRVGYRPRVSTLLDRPPSHDPLRVHELGDADRAEVEALVETDPIVNVVVGSRLQALGSLEARRFGGQLVGVRASDGRLTAAGFSGGNLLPIGGGPAEWAAMARFVAGQPRVCSSIVGRADAVEAMWEILRHVWGPARTIRAAQPLLALDTAVASRPADVGLRAIRVDELDAYLPAAAAMFTEELGVSPYVGGGAGNYRSRVLRLIRDGRAFGVVERSGEVVFKADLGAISARTCQIQGVWVRPDLRGRGLGTAAMVGVLDRALAVAPTASLYVNEFNVAARRMYAALGMRHVATLSTVLL
jgi:predicted GNAT family acetyltransferase